MTDLLQGKDLPSIKKVITQANINRYAQASKDFNPIHIDLDFAKKTPLGGTIAHGMLVLGYVSQMMTETFGHNWLNSGKMGIRFKTPARPGDTLIISGRIDTIVNHHDTTLVTCQLKCSNQKDEIVIMGDAQVKISGDNKV
jgi:acyl dehydratase